MKKYSFNEFAQISFNLATHYYNFNRFPYLDREKIEAFQLERIKKIVRHAYDTVPFYRQKYDAAGVSPADIKSLADFEKFPTTTKDEILENYPKNVISKGTSLQRCILSRSSGSTGKFMTIVHQPKDTFPYVLGRYRIFRMMCNYTPFTTVLYIYTSPFPASSIFGLYKSHFIETLNDIADTKRKILSIKPDVLNLYPSHLIELSKMFTPEEAKNLGLKAISVGSELSTQKQRNSLGGFFGCKVFDEYSSEELTWIAAQCKYDNHHLFEDLNYIEILKPGTDAQAKAGQPGEIVGTHFWNFAMPFIRYRQGDIGKVNKNKRCKCGSNMAVLTELQGRKNDAFKLEDGRALSSGYLLDLTYNLLLNIGTDVTDFCLIQQRKNKMLLQVKTGKNFRDSDITKIKEYFVDKIGYNVQFSVRKVAELYKTKTGKRNPIISLVK